MLSNEHLCLTSCCHQAMLQTGIQVSSESSRAQWPGSTFSKSSSLSPQAAGLEAWLRFYTGPGSSSLVARRSMSPRSEALPSAMQMNLKLWQLKRGSSWMPRGQIPSYSWSHRWMGSPALLRALALLPPYSHPPIDPTSCSKNKMDNKSQTSRRQCRTLH